MEETGKIIAVLPERNGISSRTGQPWRIASYVIQRLDRYETKMQFELSGAEKIDAARLQVGDIVKVNCDVTASEYEGKWYNRVSAWKVERVGYQATTPLPQTQQPTAGFPPPTADPQTMQYAQMLGGGTVQNEGLPFPPPIS